MMALNSRRLALGSIVLLIHHLRPALAQNCYYPNGNLDTSGVAACSSDGGVCCPLHWDCMSNGLCYNPTDNFTGRYTCTDSSWADPNCPEYCTQDDTAAGNEAIQICDDGKLCCDGNGHTSPHCCDRSSGVVWLDIESGTSVASISSVAPPSTDLPSTRAISRPVTTTSVESTTEESTTTTPSPSTTFTSEAVTTNSAGAPTTIIIVSTAPASEPTATASPPQQKSHSPSTGMIAGLVCGIFALLAFLALAFFLYRRTKKSREAHHLSTNSAPTDYIVYPSSSEKPQLPLPTAPEADSYPVSKPQHLSELSGSPPASFPQSPAVSSLENGYASRSSPVSPAMTRYSHLSQGAVPNTWSTPQAADWGTSAAGSGGYAPYREQQYAPYRPAAVELPASVPGEDTWEREGLGSPPPGTDQGSLGSGLKVVNV